MHGTLVSFIPSDTASTIHLIARSLTSSVPCRFVPLASRSLAPQLGACSEMPLRAEGLRGYTLTTCVTGQWQHRGSDRGEATSPSSLPRQMKNVAMMMVLIDQ